MSIHFLMQRVALSGAEETEQQDPETIHLTRQCSLGGEKKIQNRKKPQNIHTQSYFFLQHVNSALDFSPSLWGTQYSTQHDNSLIMHILA